MLERRILPSQKMPDYFKIELGVGTDEPHPIVPALDNFASRLMSLSGRVGLSLSSYLRPEISQRSVLARMGFSSETLSSQEVDAFFSACFDILAEVGMIGSIEKLAELYFPGSLVERGRPIEAQSMSAGTSFRLTDPKDRNRVIFVRLPSPADSTRIDEFVSNATRLLPANFAVLVAAPKVEVEKPCPGIRLSGDLRVKERRL